MPHGVVDVGRDHVGYEWLAGVKWFLPRLRFQLKEQPGKSFSRFFRSVRAGERDKVPLAVYVRPNGAGFSAMRLILGNCFSRPTHDGTLVDSHQT